MLYYSSSSFPISSSRCLLHILSSASVLRQGSCLARPQFETTPRAFEQTTQPTVLDRGHSFSNLVLWRRTIFGRCQQGPTHNFHDLRRIKGSTAHSRASSPTETTETNLTTYTLSSRIFKDFPSIQETIFADRATTDTHAFRNKTALIDRVFSERRTWIPTDRS